MSFVSNYAAVSVTGTPTLIMASQPERKGCLIQNNDATETIYLGMNGAVTVANGLPLKPGSTLVNSDFGAAWRGAIWAISSGASVDTRFWEWGP